MIMSGYDEIIQKRDIKRLCHFTKSSNLPFILGDGKFEKNGILSTRQVKTSPILNAMDSKRYDNKLDYVCCSVQHLNPWYFGLRKKENGIDIFHEWALLYIDPSIIDDTTLFCPVNAATRSGAYIKQGEDAFRSLFDEEINWTTASDKPRHAYRNSKLQDNCTTSDQAEVLIKDKIPIEKIIGVAFPMKTFEAESKRMQFWYNGNIVPTISEDLDGKKNSLLR